MRKLILGLAGAAALAFGSTANASVTIDGTNMDFAGATDGDLTFSAGYVELGGDSPFSAWLTFTETLDGIYSFDLQSIATLLNGGIVGATDVDFTSVSITGGSIVGSLFLSAAGDSTDQHEHYVLQNVALDAGTYTLTIQGTRGATSSFTGDISFAAVPEPATWAMMLLGFGAVGFAMRRRRQPALMQLA